MFILFRFWYPKQTLNKLGAVIQTLRKGRGPDLQKFFFRPLGPQFGLKTSGPGSPDHMIFSNSFMMSEEPEVGQLVSFIPDVEIKFRCTYGRKNITRRIGKVAL